MNDDEDWQADDTKRKGARPQLVRPHASPRLVLSGTRRRLTALEKPAKCVYRAAPGGDLRRAAADLVPPACRPAPKDKEAAPKPRSIASFFAPKSAPSRPPAAPQPPAREPSPPVEILDDEPEPLPVAETEPAAAAPAAEAEPAKVEATRRSGRARNAAPTVVEDDGASGQDGDDEDFVAPKRARRSGGGGGAKGEFFMTAAERKRLAAERKAAEAERRAEEAKRREAEEAEETARARVRRIEEARAREREENERNAACFRGKQLHGFFTVPRAAAAGAGSGSGGGRSLDAAGSLAALPPPLPPLHVGYSAALPPAPVWPEGMLAPADAPPPPAFAVHSGSALPQLCCFAAPAAQCAPAAPDALADSSAAGWDEAVVAELAAWLTNTATAPASGAAPGADASLLEESGGDGDAMGVVTAALLLRLRRMEAQRVAEAEAAGSNCLWTARYAPAAASDVLPCGRGADAVAAWLREWKEHIEVSERPGAAPAPPRAPAPRRRRDSDWGDFVGEDSGSEGSDEGDEGAAPDTVLLLSGPCGCGKSAAAHAAAAELGFRVIEVPSNARRGGAEVTARVEEATQSRRMLAGRDAAAAAAAQQAALLAPAAAPMPQPARTAAASKPKRRRGAICSDDEDDIVAMEPAGRAASPNAGACEADGDAVAGGTLLLFDEADVLWSEDRGFSGALAALAAGAKRPMLLTANSPWALLGALPARGVRLVCVDRPGAGADAADAAAHLVLCAAAERRRLPPRRGAALLAAAGGDVRRAMLAAQLDTAGGAAAFEAPDSALEECGDEWSAFCAAPDAPWAADTAREPPSAAALLALADAEARNEARRAPRLAATVAHVRMRQLQAAAAAAQKAKDKAAAAAARMAERAKAYAGGGSEEAVKDASAEELPTATDEPTACDAPSAMACDDAAAPTIATEGTAAPDAAPVAAPGVEGAAAAAAATSAPEALVAAEPAAADAMMGSAAEPAAMAGVTAAEEATAAQPEAPPAPPPSPLRRHLPLSASAEAAVAELASLALFTASLSSADALRCAAPVTSTGPRPRHPGWRFGATIGASDGGEAGAYDDAEDEAYDAAGPLAGRDGGAPRRQLGGCTDVATEAAARLAAGALRTLTPAAGGAGAPPPPRAATAPCRAAPDGGWTVATARMRTLLADEAEHRFGIAEATSAVVDCVAFCARIARIEADRYKHVLGRRRRTVVRGRHLDAPDAALKAFIQAGTFADAPPL